MRRLSVASRIRRAWQELRGLTAQRNVYAGARLSRLEFDWVASTVSADEEIKRDSRRLRARARELSRNDPFAKHYLRLLGVNVIGPTGFDHQAEVRDNSGVLSDRINSKIEEAFADWSEAVTVDGRLSRVRFEHQILRTTATDGEAFVRLWRGPQFRYGLALEAIDADQVDETLNIFPGKGQNEIRMGIEIDRFGRPVAYWFWTRPPEAGAQRERIRVPADQVRHFYDPDRVNQTRGVTWFHSVMLPMRFLNGYSESELVAARISAAKMGIWQRREGQSVDEIPNPSTGPIVEEANPGTFGFAPEGYELADWNPNHPSTAYGDFVRQQLRQIATGLGVSYEALTSDLADATYSSMKAGRQNERDVWKTLQQWWAGAFLQPLYREWMTQALLVGASGGTGLQLDLRDPRKFLAVRWAGRGWLSPDPLKDMNAAVLAIENGMGTRTQVLAELGLDYDEVIERLAKEQDLAASLNVSISSTAAKSAGAQALSDANAADAAAALPSKNGKAHVNRVFPEV